MDGQGLEEIMKNLKNNQSRRMVVFIETDEEKKIATKMLLNNPDLFIWAEEDDSLPIEIELNKTIDNNVNNVLFLRRGVNYTTSEEGNDLEILR